MSNNNNFISSFPPPPLDYLNYGEEGQLNTTNNSNNNDNISINNKIPLRYKTYGKIKLNQQFDPDDEFSLIDSDLRILDNEKERLYDIEGVQNGNINWKNEYENLLNRIDNVYNDIISNSLLINDENEGSLKLYDEKRIELFQLLDELFANLFELTNFYRIHEAREEIINILNLQLNNRKNKLKELENDLNEAKIKIDEYKLEMNNSLNEL